MKARALAKVNLALHVLGRRADGYHELDSLVAFVRGVGDDVVIRPADTFRLELQGPLAQGLPGDERNLALRAAMLLVRRWPDEFSPVHVRLRKRLPSAAGLGGGSADAAAVIRAMCRLFGFTPPADAMRALAWELGADVPVCIHSRSSRMRGIGENTEPVPLPAAVPVLLANPAVSVSTAAVFEQLAAGPVNPARALPPMSGLHRHAGLERWVRMLAQLRNDLQPVACRLAPAISECLHALRRQPGAMLVRMSGSGATCLAVFRHFSAARQAAATLARQHPRWWLRAGWLQ